MIGEPDRVVGAVEVGTIVVQTAGRHLKHRRTAMPGSDLDRCPYILGEMHVVTTHPLQTLAQDPLDSRLPCPVVQKQRRNYGFELQIDRQTVPLVRPDSAAGVIQTEPPLVVSFHNLGQLVAGQRVPGPTARIEQLVDIHPPARIKPQP